MKKVITMSLLLFVTFSLIQAKKLEFESLKPDQKITVDGELNEWEDVDATLWNDDIYVSFQHDENYLYGVIITGDTETKHKMLTMGSTLWFNTKGKTKQQIGVKFPIGINREKMKQMPSRDEMMKLDEKERISKLIESTGDEIIIFRGKKDILKTTLSETPGIEFKIKETDGLLVYEFKVPCVENNPFKISVYPQKGDRIGFGLEIGRDRSTKRPPKQADRSMRPDTANRPNGMSERGSHDGRNRENNMKMDLQPIKLWGIIELRK